MKALTKGHFVGAPIVMCIHSGLHHASRGHHCGGCASHNSLDSESCVKRLQVLLRHRSPRPANGNASFGPHQPTADRRQIRDAERPPHKYFRPQPTRASVTPASFPPARGLQTLNSDGRNAGPPQRPPTLPALRAAFPRATPRGHPHSVGGLQDRGLPRAS